MTKISLEVMNAGETTLLKTKTKKHQQCLLNFFKCRFNQFYIVLNSRQYTHSI